MTSTMTVRTILGIDAGIPAENVSEDIADVFALCAMVDKFAMDMKRKLIAKKIQGYGKWDDLDMRDFLMQNLLVHINKGDMVDVANFAAMIHNLGER